MNQFFNALQRFGIGRLGVMIGVGAGAAALIAAILFNLGGQPKALLYSNLDLREASQVTQALDQAGVKYELKGDGSTIMVDRDKVGSSRLLVSGKGLVTSGSIGYEIFDNQSALGQTDFVQQLNMKRAMEGELARDIRSMQGVNFARVHLVLPRRQLFEDEAEQPSASVTIGLGAREPTAEQIRAVQNLIAGAVPNLKPDRVTVVDQSLKTLSGGSDSSYAGRAAQDAKSTAEERIRKTVKDLVEGVVGQGAARVQVSADVDMAQVTTQEEKFDPDGQVVRSEQTGEENSRENQSSASGASSATANIPGAGVGAGAGTSDNGNASGRNESTTNYEISKTVRTEVQAPGAIKRLSVAVAVDGVNTPGPKGKPGAYAPRTAEEMKRLDDLVRAAIGFSADRGDVVSVVNVRFPHVEDENGVTASSPLMGFDKNDIMRVVEVALLAVVAMLILFFVVRPLVKGVGAGGAGGLPMLAGGGGVPVTRVVTTAEGQTYQVEVDPATGQPLALPPPHMDQKINMAKIEGQVKASSVKQVSEFVDKHPEESVSILRSWLHETA